MEKDELIARIRELNGELSLRFLSGFSQNVLSGYLRSLEITAKLDKENRARTEMPGDQASPPPAPDPDTTVT